MPETLRYSVVAAMQTMWLAARAEGLGMGWVSILDPAEVTRALDVPEGWRLVAYLDLGWPAEEHLDPELERHHWEQRHYTGDLRLYALTLCTPAATIGLGGSRKGSKGNAVHCRGCPRNCERRASTDKATGCRKASWEGGRKRGPASQETCH